MNMLKKDDAFQRFRTFAQNAEQIWYIRDMPTQYSAKFLSVLAENFQVVQRIVMDKDHEVIALERTPQSLLLLNKCCQLSTNCH